MKRETETHIYLTIQKQIYLLKISDNKNKIISIMIS
jgi:hypothetical protein